MDVALVKHAEHDVNRQERGQNQQRFVGERRLEGLRRALETRLNRSRHPKLLLGSIDGAHGIAQRDARRKIERERDRRELALMIDGERRGCPPRSA